MDIRNFLWSIVFKKGIKQLVQVLISLTGSISVSKILNDSGISIDQTKLTIFLTGLFHGGLEMARNYLKIKFGLKFL